MSKYYKAEDVINLLATEYYTNALAEGVDVKESDFKEDAIANTKHLPTIEVSEDCISREDAIKAYNEAIDELVKAEMEEFNLGDFTECSFNTTQLKLIARKIENAPSVVPSRVEGEWVHLAGIGYRCSNCNEYTKSEKPFHKPKGNYCPNCGAKMKKQIASKLADELNASITLDSDKE